MEIFIDDTAAQTKLHISNNGKSLLKKKFKSVKSALRFIVERTKKQNVKDAIQELEPIFKYMVGSKFETTIKETE